jgi:hypothetical protein
MPSSAIWSSIVRSDALPSVRSNRRGGSDDIDTIFTESHDMSPRDCLFPKLHFSITITPCILGLDFMIPSFPETAFAALWPYDPSSNIFSRRWMSNGEMGGCKRGALYTFRLRDVAKSSHAYMIHLRSSSHVSYLGCYVVSSMLTNWVRS